jgi:hypothetical protein
MTPEPVLILSDAHGIYIPRNFTLNVARERVTEVNDEDWATLAAGPDHEHYWEAWDVVLTNAIVTDDHSRRYRLHQDGDLWLIPVGMTWDEEADDWRWPYDSTQESPQ